MRHRQPGFSLVELMIAILLAAITAIVVLQVLSSYQTRKTTTAGRNDSQINAALGLFAVEREVRMAGAGLTTSTGLLCDAGINVYYDGAVVSNGAPLALLRIIDGGAGPDTLEIMRSDSNFGAAPTRLVQAMASATAPLGVDGRAGFASGNLMLVGAADGSKICTLMQLTEAPTANGSGWLLTHDSATSDFNPADPVAAFANALQYEVRDNVVNLGNFGIRRFSIVCDGGGTPAANNNCDLGWYDRLTTPDPPSLADVESITPQVVDLQAQYGVAPAGSQTVNAWVDATDPDWATPTLADQRRIKAVRVALVTRGNHEGTVVSPASLVLWDAGLGTERTRALDTDERHYRYQVLTVVIPLINVIWAGT